MGFDLTQEKTIQDAEDRVVRITEAVYRTTDIFSDHEPLKWSLRDSAVQIVNLITSGSKYDFSRVSPLIKAMMLKLHLAASGAFVARANFDVLERAYRDLEAFIHKLNSELVALPMDTISLQNLLDTPIKKDISDSMSETMSDILVGHEKSVEKLVTKIQTHSFTSNAQNQSIKAGSGGENGSAQQERHEQARDFFVPRERPQIVEKKQSISRSNHMLPRGGPTDNRKDTILKLVKERGPSSIGDLVKSIGLSVSEKTIQRDLNALADSGFLQKEGEKRWRRYFITQ